RLRQAKVLPFAGDVEGARAILEEIALRDPEDRAALHALADLEAAAGAWSAAVVVLKRLADLAEGEAFVDAVVHLAETCEKAGRPGDGRQALERAYRDH